MLILPVFATQVPPFPPGQILLVRVTFLTPHAATRKDTYVRIERSPDEDDALFVKAIREYRTLHGDTQRIVAIDLYPNQ